MTIYRVQGIVGMAIMSPISWQDQNLSCQSLAFIIDLRVLPSAPIFFAHLTTIT